MREVSSCTAGLVPLPATRGPPLMPVDTWAPTDGVASASQAVSPGTGGQLEWWLALRTCLCPASLHEARQCPQLSGHVSLPPVPPGSERCPASPPSLLSERRAVALASAAPCGLSEVARPPVPAAQCLLPLPRSLLSSLAASLGAAPFPLAGVALRLDSCPPGSPPLCAAPWPSPHGVPETMAPDAAFLN